jgi:hypothetical protein
VDDGLSWQFLQLQLTPQIIQPVTPIQTQPSIGRY